MNAIVSLIRGHDDLKKYDLIIGRNLKIYEFVNQKFSQDYPIVLFHEGNIDESQQQYIREKSGPQTIEFVDISDTWNKSSGGYEAMCRFNSYDIWNYCKKYECIFRIDDDCYLTQCDEDPFSLIGNNEFLRSIYFDESHGPTNATLPVFIQNLIGVHPSSFYNHRFPYTNVLLSRVDFWLDVKVNRVLKEISYSQFQAQYRWGDLPILGSLLNIFAPGRVGKLNGIKYDHVSHGTIIDCTTENCSWVENYNEWVKNYE